MAHPLLRYPGTHRVDYVTRNRQDVHEWSRMETVWVNIDAPFWQGTKKVEKGAGVALSDAPSTENIDGFQRSDFGIYSERDAVEGGCRQTGVEAPWWFILMLAGGSIVGRRRSDLGANRL